MYSCLIRAFLFVCLFVFHFFEYWPQGSQRELCGHVSLMNSLKIYRLMVALTFSSHFFPDVTNSLKGALSEKVMRNDLARETI